MRIETEIAHGAVEARDKRFDGLFVTGVTSTGIYCRCVCPAKTPKRDNRRFFPTAAAAEQAGFRPCLLCRPELAPGAAPIDAAERLAHDALRRIEAGALEEAGLETLAADMGITGRHLRRVMIETYGAAPLQLAQTHRLLSAKRLLADSDLTMTQIALAAGFRSVRRFNALFAERYRMAPSKVRKREGKTRAQMLTLRFAARGPVDPDYLLDDLSRHGIGGVEYSPGLRSWARTLVIGAHAGWLSIELDEQGGAISLSEGLFPVVRQVVAAVRGAFDFDADIGAIRAALIQSGGFDAQSPYVRLPGSLDPFEQAVRTVIGQQVTLRAAATIGARLTARFGATMETPHPALTHLFPGAARLAEAESGDIAALGMPGKRAETIVALARAVADGKLRLARGAVAAGRAGLMDIPGIGPWTREYIALRALGDPDAFPFGDAALKNVFDEGNLEKAAAAWRPWRGYAAALLWSRHAVQSRKAA
jgi:AraC family transcriptional regulator of adaptative response / DNA-3-methyladenine glycosylase II